MAGPGPTHALTADLPIEIGFARGRSLKAPSSPPTAELRRLIRAVESA
jgi:hypothetical protein